MRMRKGEFFRMIISAVGLFLLIGTIGGSDLDRLNSGEVLVGLLVSLSLLTIGVYAPVFTAPVRTLLKRHERDQTPRGV